MTTCARITALSSTSADASRATAGHTIAAIRSSPSITPCSPGSTRAALSASPPFRAEGILVDIAVNNIGVYISRIEAGPTQPTVSSVGTWRPRAAESTNKTIGALACST
jgi:hypothetical protein